MNRKSLDVVIVGAGLSGIGAAAHLGMKCPDKSYVVLEARDNMGGTWDLFRYPGIRSDSDMHTLGFSFYPWRDPKAIADGPAIKKYIKETADQFEITPKVKLNHKVTSAKWSSEKARWLVSADSADGSTHEFECRYLFMGSGYYSYNQGHDPDFEGKENFKGQVVHPQFWPEDLDYKNKRVVVIGSGATAVTLVPEMSKEAAHVTMLQRSPTYIVARPGQDWLANFLRKFSENLSYTVTRWKNILLGRYFNRRARKKPADTAQRLLKWAEERLPEGYDMRHLTPSYNPWDQRICLAPDGDFFEAISGGKASIETDHIDRFTENGILLKSGKTLEADVIITATGLQLLTGGHVNFEVDGKPIKFGEVFSYKGVMFSEVPNMVLVFGYTMSSWTLKADLAAIYFCRLINYMDEHRVDIAYPHLAEGDKMKKRPIIDFSSGYVVRAVQDMPKQGDKQPWLVNQDYLVDRKVLLHEAVEDGVLTFKKVPDTETAATFESGSVAVNQ